MSSGTCWHCEGDHDTGDCPTRKQWTVEHQPVSPGVDLDELERDGHEWDHGQLLRAARSLGSELRTLRARVEELERVHAWKVVDLETMIQNEHKLYADAHDQMLKAEARVKELEVAFFVDAGETHDRLVALVESKQARITDLEAQLAAAREEQGLEDRVATALGPRYQALQLTRLAMSGIWQACWCAPAWSSRNERKAQAPTLPALLRAILAVEKRRSR